MLVRRGQARKCCCPAMIGRSGGVALGFLGVGAAGWCFPLMPAGFGLSDFPAGCLFDLVAGAASCSGVAGAGPAALVVGDGVLEVGLFGVAGAGRQGALGVADLDQVAEHVVGLVGVRLPPVVAVVGGEGLEG